MNSPAIDAMILRRQELRDAEARYQMEVGIRNAQLALACQMVTYYAGWMGMQLIAAVIDRGDQP